MKIAIASDHVGYQMKNEVQKFLTDKHIEVIDLGTNSEDRVDYPHYADKVSAYVLAKKADLGILICGTGIGISMAANRHKGIRAALLYSDEVTELTRKHNNANVMVFGGWTMDIKDVCRRIDIFLNTEFEGGRHQKRIDLMDN